MESDTDEVGIVSAVGSEGGRDRGGEDGDEQREAALARKRASAKRRRHSREGKAWQKRWDAEHRERRLAQRREYNRRPDVIARKAQYKAANREKIAVQKREAERKRLARIAAREAANAKKRARYREDPEPAKARMRAWALEHPDRVKEIKAASRERNREARNARDRARYAADAEQRRDWQREYRTRPENRERIAAQKRQSEVRRRSADREAYNAYQREYRQREKRRRELGLPPRPMHRSSRAEIEANEVAAFHFFAVRRAQSQVRQVGEEALLVHRAATLPQVEQSREAASRDAARLIESAEARARREADRFAAFMAGEGGATLREEVEMDNAAREHFGKEPYPDVPAEVNRRAKALLAGDDLSSDAGDALRKVDEQMQKLRAEHARRLAAQDRRAATGPVVAKRDISSISDSRGHRGGLTGG